MANKNLNAAKTAKKDEFYTQMTDIERELQHYWQHFRDKVVLCNCDDPYESNFFKYFALRFNQLGLKKLICTCYNGSPVQGNELMIDFGDFTDEPKKIAYKVEITEVKDLNGDGGYNDLLYIPTDAQVDEMLAKNQFVPVTSQTTGKVTKTPEQQASDMKEWIHNDPYLSKHQGEYYDRNVDNEKWENRLDLHIDHKFGFRWGKDIRYFQIGFDIINFTNMLNKKWGATLSQGGYNYYSPVTYGSLAVYTADATGVPQKTYQRGYQFSKSGNYDMRSYNDYYSRWRMQLTAKLTF